MKSKIEAKFSGKLIIFPIHMDNHVRFFYSNNNNALFDQM